jgi:hypothetical protein
MLNMGPYALNGLWLKPEEGSFLDIEIKENNLKVVDIPIQPYISAMLSNISKSAYSPSLSHLKNLSNVTDLSTLTAKDLIQKQTCSHYQVTNLDPTNYMRQAKSSCALSFVIPGFMKSGTSFLFDIIAQHPQVLLTLKGMKVISIV